ncbi:MULTISPECIES: sensor histidine kinase [unclassified Shinella]|uniref:sensor histidine kinase n=1 Tax=unclassified Shinella TaxID=2643062 RepID=UPI00225C79D5|nr:MULTISPECIES: sensor histidine kinase [unclassified Shinella]MCO5136974.1 sensor histidine kinase [Shinella sp.]MDC7253348.1 sensor histidine kinase [Shinella sp. YE25]CAI0340838.1 Two-component sensor histidine kinase [Rhizobiaceae bacterium]CAK7259182.1 histidine kinase [Shinella sp. WSC3-e]
MHHPVAFYLVCLILVVVIPAFLFSIVVLKRTNEAQERIFESLLRTSTSAVNRAVEREITAMFSTLNFLSTSESLPRGDYATLHAQATKTLQGTDTYFLVIDQAMRQRLNTRVPFGTPLNTASEQVSARLALSRGERMVSDLFFGRTAQHWVFNVYMPVRLANGEPVLLTLTKNAEALRRAVNPDILSPGWNAAVLDSAGTVIASTDEKQKTGQPFFLRVVPSLRLGVSAMRRDGVDYQVVTEFSSLAGWRMIAWAKASDVQAPAVSSFLWLTIGGAVFAALAAISAVGIARVLSRDVRLLAHDARRLGLGERVSPRPYAISELETVSRALAEAADARVKSENEVRFLMREVAHRSKNQLTVIQAMLNQSAAAAENASDFAETFRRRVAGLARSTDLMIANATQGVNLMELAKNQLKPFTPDDAGRVRIAGPSVLLDPQASQTLGMALHELSTNATKYGALANETGIISLSWVTSGANLNLIWRESRATIDRQAIAASRKGFGSVVLERMLGMALDAKLDFIVHDDGIEWRVTIPLARLRDEDGHEQGAAQ